MFSLERPLAKGKFHDIVPRIGRGLVLNPRRCAQTS